MGKQEQGGGGGSIAQWLAYLLPDPFALSSVPKNPKIYSEVQIINFSEGNKLHWLEESGQWLENVDQTQQVLAS